MLGSVMLEVFIGLVLTYTLLSIICLTINEWITACFQARAKILENGLKAAIGNDLIVQKIYTHPLIGGATPNSNLSVNRFFSPCYMKNITRPAYIQPELLSAVIVDILKDGDGASVNSEVIEKAIENLPACKLRGFLECLFLSAKKDIDIFKHSLSLWFNNFTEGLTGLYKRRMQLLCFIVALLVTIASNADTLQLIDKLYTDTSLRLTANNLSLTINALPLSEQQPAELINRLFYQSGIPLGWHTAKVLPSTFIDWVCKIIGWLLTTAAISLGAPFWFDILNRLVDIRLSGRRPKLTNQTPS